jgi:AraC-like DNA-binding protein
MSTVRIQEAIDFIEKNLTNVLSPKSIALETGWSEWHFQRIFHSTVGIVFGILILRIPAL